MAKLPENSRKGTNGWDAAIRIVNRFVTSGYAFPVLIAATLCVCLWIVARGMESGDLKELIVALVDRFSGWMIGWVMFVIASGVYFLLLRFTKRQYEGEINRQRLLIEKLLPSQTTNNLKLE